MIEHNDVRIRLNFDGYQCNRKCPLVCIEFHLGVVVVTRI